MNPFADLDDEQLLAQCRVEFRRASGPGGQHRNKVESAVRLTHEPTGITTNGTESRSQLANKRVALARLRERLAERFRRVERRIPTRKSAAVRRRERVARSRITERRRTRARPADDD